MMFILFLVAIAVTATATKIEEIDHTTRFNWDGIVSAVNKEGSSWTASVPSRLHNATHADAKKMLGTILPHEEGYTAPAVIKTEFNLKGDIPDSFDVRTAWPECSPVTNLVRDQSSCGSCWAFGSTQAFNDRYCIKTGDSETLFSVEDTAACCSGMKCSMSMGCNGGQPSGAWNWFTKEGVVSGGDYPDMNTGKSCSPYSLQGCAHHVAPTGDEPACDDLPNYKTPACPRACESGYPLDFNKDKHFATSSYGIHGVENMQRELMEHGTISVSLTVYEDFEAYTSGVYQHTTGQALGGHAVTMLGWGVDEETNTPYWLCKNNWNDSWAEGGYFRILRGSNECGIESGSVAGEA